MPKLFDIVAKVGEYEAQGKTKGRYLNVGAVMQGKDGGQFILLEKWFNPAGLQGDKDSVLLSCFEPKGKERKTSDDDVPW